MKLAFLKIDYIEENDTGKIIHIPSGGIQFEYKGQTIQSIEPISIEMEHEGIYRNIARDVQLAVYKDQSIFASSEIKTESLFNIIAHEDMQRAIHNQMINKCKIVPFFRPIDEKELFRREFEYAYK